MDRSNPSARSFVQAPDPTPAEIAQRCQQIQAGWSARERLSRAGVYGEPPGVEVPVVNTDGAALDVRGK